jgi:fluoroacetyl-CoA thioesterase
LSIQPGLSAEHSTIVTNELIATAFGSGDLPVFATPALLALMETAARLALQPALDTHQTSVGTQAEIRHVAATPVGVEVRAHAEVTAVDGRTVTFKVEAWDSHGLIGDGTHQRAIVDIERFLKRVAEKQPPQIGT